MLKRYYRNYKQSYLVKRLSRLLPTSLFNAEFVVDVEISSGEWEIYEIQQLSSTSDGIIIRHLTLYGYGIKKQIYNNTTTG